MDGTLKSNHWKAVELYFTVVLFGFQCYRDCDFGLGTVKSERVKLWVDVGLVFELFSSKYLYPSCPQKPVENS